MRGDTRRNGLPKHTPKSIGSSPKADRTNEMKDSQPEPADRGETGGSSGASDGPAQWVPKGALSRFMLEGAAVAFVAQALALLSGFGSQVLLARLLSPEGLGVYFLTQSLVIMTANIGELGLNRPVARMLSTDVGAGRVGAALRVLRSAAGIAAVWGSLVVLAFVSGLGQWIAWNVFDSAMMAGSMVLVGIWIAGRIVLDLGAAVHQGLHRVGLSAMLNSAFAPTILTVSCGLLLLTGTRVDYEMAIAIASGATVVGGVLCIAMAWRPFSGIVADGPSRMGALFAGTLPIFGAGMLQVAAVQADLWIVGAQLSASDVALYGAAKRLTVLVGFPLTVLAFVVPPLIADLYSRGEHERLQRLVRASTTAASLPAAAAFVLFVLFGEEILSLVYGSVYANGVTILQILIAERFVFLMMGPGSLSLVMTGHERVVFRITIVSATLSLLAMYLGGQLWGLNGVAAAYAVTSSATGLWYLLEARRQTRIWVHINPLAVKPIFEVLRSRFRIKS
jgi:O-antigen/teichoic acid export membrane protein